jgi:hypothetical protein
LKVTLDVLGLDVLGLDVLVLDVLGEHVKKHLVGTGLKIYWLKLKVSTSFSTSKYS